jgi:hypothetical protein
VVIKSPSVVALLKCVPRLHNPPPLLIAHVLHAPQEQPSMMLPTAFVKLRALKKLTVRAVELIVVLMVTPTKLMQQTLIARTLRARHALSMLTIKLAAVLHQTATFQFPLALLQTEQRVDYRT